MGKREWGRGIGIFSSLLSGFTHVVICGMPNLLEDFMQEAGRAGRDGKDCYCILFTRPKSGSQKGHSREYCNVSDCLREFLHDVLLVCRP